MNRSTWTLAVSLLLIPAGSAQAAMVTVNPVTVTVNGTPTNIGSISVTTTDSGNANKDVSMQALFTLTRQDLLSCVSFHWVQVITHVTTNLQYPNGTNLSMSTPVIDTPNGGYWFNGMRTPAGEDDLPWYWTIPEENKAGTGKTNFPSDRISDAPTLTAGTFKTWLVLQDATDIANQEFTVLAGFTWTTGADGNASKLASLGGPSAADVTQINTALANSGFNDGTTIKWSADRNENVVCPIPEPASLTLALVGGTLALGGQYFWRKRAA